MVRDLPDPPRDLWRIVGPGVVAAGVGISSGEFILWPYIASQAGLVFLWGAVARRRHAVLPQHGDRALHARDRRDGADRVQPIVEALGPGVRRHGVLRQPVARLGAELGDARTYLFGGSAAVIAIGMLLVIGAALTLAPVVYVALERLIFVKVGAVVDVRRAGDGVRDQRRHAGARCRAASSGVGDMPLELGFALLFGAIAFAGAGGGQNLCQSNWIRDKGFGMGAVRAAAGEPADRRRRGRADRRVGLHLRDDAGQHGAVAAMVAVRQRRAAA